MTGTIDVSRNPLRGWFSRTVVFIVVWLILFGFDPVALLAGVPVALIATWTSLRLLPAGPWNFRPGALAQLVFRFLRQSIVAGIDVAWRALDPRLPPLPGFVTYQTHLPPGPMRDAFCTMTGLLPGTLPCGVDESGRLVIHCLDTGQPVAEQLAAEEALLIHALGRTHSNG